jgi:DNA polymerase elongation subunit (family B)
MSFYTNVASRGNTILYRGYNQDGAPIQKKIAFQPTLYLKTDQEPTHYGLDGAPLREKHFESINEAKEFVEKYKDVDNLQVYGSSNFVTQFIQKRFPNDIKFDAGKINIVSFDIEVDIEHSFPDMNTAENEITSISFKSSRTNTYYLLAVKDYDKTKTITGIDPDDIRFEKCLSEKHMLGRFVQLWSGDYPDIVTGWNVEFFDIRYIVLRIIRLLGEEKAKELSPWGRIRERSVEMFGKEQKTYHIEGVSVIDYMDAFKKFGYKYGTQASYKLDNICEVVLGEKKVDYSEYGSLTELYKRNPQLYLDYSLKDTYLLQRLEDETGLLSLTMTVAYGGGVNYGDAFGTVGIWESTLYRRMMSENIVPPVKSVKDRSRGDIAGGYVKDPVPGMYDWIVSYDLNSLYPMIMIQYNMSPETYLPKRKEMVTPETVMSGNFQNQDPTVAVAANGACFTKAKRGIIPQVIEEYYARRKKVKKQMLGVEQEIEDARDPKEKLALKKKANQLHNEQMAIKIAMNSLYGATANIHFQYYIQEMAEAITLSGQLAIRWAEKTFNEYFNQVLKTKDVDYTVYIDTDSNHLNLAPLVEATFGTVDIDRDKGEAFIDKVCKQKLDKVIAAGYQDLANLMGAYENKMEMAREKINRRAVFTGKKRYVLSTLNSEGVHYATPKISVTGIEAVRSSTPEVCRKKMMEAFRVIIDGSEADIQEFVEEFRKEFFRMPAGKIAKISGTDNIEKYMSGSSYRQGCPIHIRGCIVYNNFIEGHHKRLPKIVSGDKIKFVYMKLPNPLRENIVSFVDDLDSSLDLDQYIDYETQFDKVFRTPIQNIISCLGWNTEKIATLEDLFSD